MTGLAIGMSVNEFNEMKELEVMTFRRNILEVSEQAVFVRDLKGLHSQALYVYPPEICSTSDLPPHIEKRIQDGICSFTEYLYTNSIK